LRAGPMVELLRSEWMKATKNIVLITFLIWVLPIGIIASFGIFTITGLFSETMRTAIEAFSSGSWTSDVLMIWSTVTTFPTNVLPRMIPLAFIAVGFAGEYQWGTWKNIIPRTKRTSLILSKFIVLVSIIVITMLISSVLLGLVETIAHAVGGLPYGPLWGAEVLKEFAPDYAGAFLIGLIAVAILGGYGAFAGIITRSILGALLLSFFFSVLDAMSFGGLLFLGSILGKPNLINLYLFTPSYNIDNMRSWFDSGSAYIPGPGFTTSPGIWISIGILLIWVILLLGSSIYIFNKQDVTS
jgi:ABC-type transport system involved in multi-copper enzyme maturation permease subunit